MDEGHARWGEQLQRAVKASSVPEEEKWLVSNALDKVMASLPGELREAAEEEVLHSLAAKGLPDIATETEDERRATERELARWRASESGFRRLGRVPLLSDLRLRRGAMWLGLACLVANAVHVTSSHLLGVAILVGGVLIVAVQSIFPILLDAIRRFDSILRLEKRPRKITRQRPSRDLDLLASFLVVAMAGGLAIAEGLSQEYITVSAVNALFGASVLFVLLGTFAETAGRHSRSAHAEFNIALRAFEDRFQVATLSYLREQLNLERERSYNRVLEYNDHSGLAEMDNERHAISTDTKQELIDLMVQMPGGTIGLSGSRGAGKTTLMRSVCFGEKTREKEQEPLGVVVDAPVSYDPRDFVLHLFAQLCTEIIGPDEVREMRGSDNPFGIAPISTQTVLTSFGWLLGIGSLLAGISLLVLAALDAVDALGSPVAWGLVLILVGNLSSFFQLLNDRAKRRHLSGAGIPSLDLSAPHVRSAVRHLRQIWFQQSFSSGWSGGFKTPLGLDAELQGSTQIAEQQMSLPDVVDQFKEFLKEVAQTREVRIGIDELDKMDEKSARLFLNEIKAVFRIPDCFFFISISEDAMSFFERRGLPIRDVFDSSFDEVIYVPNLEYLVSRKLLDRRIIGLPIPFVCYLHCVSGGLPRDLIRAARSLVRLGKGKRLEDAATELLGESLRAKAHAAQIASRSLRDEDHATILNSWLNEIKDIKME
jgi:hypothetical protein